MRKLTENQKNVLSSLELNYLQLQEICKKYAKIQAKKGLNSWYYVWKSKVSICLNSLIKRGLVEYEYRGKYKLKQTKNEN